MQEPAGERCGYKAVYRDVKSGELFSRPEDKAPEFVWRQGELQREEGPIEICRRGFHFSTHCFGTWPFLHWQHGQESLFASVMRKGQYHEVVSVHLVTVPDDATVMKHTYDSRNVIPIDLPSRWKRVTNALTLGAPLSGIFFAGQESLTCALVACFHQGLFHSAPLSEFLAQCPSEMVPANERERLELRTDLNDWMLPTMIEPMHRDFAWFRHGQPAVALSLKLSANCHGFRRYATSARVDPGQYPKEMLTITLASGQVVLLLHRSVYELRDINDERTAKYRALAFLNCEREDGYTVAGRNKLSGGHFLSGEIQRALRAKSKEFPVLVTDLQRVMCWPNGSFSAEQFFRTMIFCFAPFRTPLELAIVLRDTMTEEEFMTKARGTGELVRIPAPTLLDRLTDKDLLAIMNLPTKLANVHSTVAQSLERAIAHVAPPTQLPCLIRYRRLVSEMK